MASTVEEVAGWPEWIALILWGIVALILFYVLYQLYEFIQQGGKTVGDFLDSLVPGSGTDGQTLGSTLEGTNPDNDLLTWNPLTWSPANIWNAIP